ncbi:MAG: TonB-dependent siderophore receptor [Planctomycetota bacterium]
MFQGPAGLAFTALVAASPSPTVPATDPVTEPTPARTDVDAKRPAGQDQEPETVVVAPPTRPESAPSYLVRESSLATHSDASLHETPWSVRVLPKEFVRDVGALELTDVARWSPGVADEKVGGFLGPVDTVFLRGFRTRAVYYDGFQVEAIPAVNPGALERVEVLRGPASVLYGTMEPGGVLNVVPKKPRTDEFLEVQQRVGTWNLHETTVGAGAPLAGSDDLFFRIDAGTRDAESFRDYYEETRQWVAGSLLWTPDADRRLEFAVSYGEQQRVIDEGVAFTSDGEAVAPIDTFLGEPGYPGQRFAQLLGEVRGEFALSPDLKLRSGVLASLWSNDMNGVRRSAPTNADDTVNRLFEDSDFRQQSFQAVNELVWDAELGSTRHEVLAGLDLRSRTNFLHLRRGSFPATSITDPVYGNPSPTITTFNDSSQDQDWAALYVQDRIDLLDDDLHLNLGARHDWIDQTNGSDTSNTENSVGDQAFTGRIGALYDLTDDVGVYASVSQSFLPNGVGTVDVNGDQLDPEKGVQFEVGTKVELLEGDASVSLALFELTKDHVAISDPLNPGFSVDAGELRSRGIEFELTGKLSHSLSAVAAYTYMDTEVIESSSLPVGAPFRNIPEHSGSLWLNYTIEGGPLDGTGFGLGARAVASRPGNDGNTFDLPCYVTVDAALFRRSLRFGNVDVDLGLNLINLFDETYYTSSLHTSRVFPGTPRSLLFTISLH